MPLTSRRGGRALAAATVPCSIGGAAGIRVHTPASNEAAVGAYEACGLRRVGWTTSVTRTG